MNEQAILNGVEARVCEHRTAEAQLAFVDSRGKPVPRVRARVLLTRHEFKLGANAFRVGNIDDPTLQAGYDQRFAALLNYATLPFYWGSYERDADATSQQRLTEMADWCRQHGIAAKGHPLVWHEVFPKWAEARSDDEVRRRLEARVRQIVSAFKGRINIWDVVNEATVSHRFDNYAGRWIKKLGAGPCVAEALGWAHAADPQATLLYNDFNVSEDFEKLVQHLKDVHAPVHAIGIQSHMHKGTWSVDKIWQTCETYARFGLPLHFTEATVLSGRQKAQEDNDWHKVQTDWLTTPDGERQQAEYGERFFTTLFSHPAVEAVTWWDFSDLGSWQGAPSGLVRRDMSPKPLYERLLTLFGKRWHTDVTINSDATGAAKARCFFGEHSVTARTESGAELKGSFALNRRGARELRVVLS